MNAIGGMRSICEPRDPTQRWYDQLLPKLAWVPEVELEVNEVYDPKGGNTSWLATAKARVLQAKFRAWGKEQNAAATVPIPEVASATKPGAGTGYCLHFPGSYLALLRDTWPTANYPRRMHNLSQTIATLCRSRPQQALPKHLNCGYHMPLSLQSDWASEP